MPNAAVVTDKAPGAGAPYSQGVSSGSMLFVSGQTGKSIETGKLAEGGLEGQAEQTLKNLGAVLEEFEELEQAMKNYKKAEWIFQSYQDAVSKRRLAHVHRKMDSLSERMRSTSDNLADEDGDANEWL